MLSERELKRHARAHVQNEVYRLGGPDKATKEDLGALADSIGATVTRGDGKDGDPLKSDFVRALGL